MTKDSCVLKSTKVANMSEIETGETQVGPNDNVVPKLVQRPIEQIMVDQELQSRAYGLNREVLKNYMEVIKLEAKIPPVKVVDGGVKKWLYDGFHTLDANQRLKFKVIDAEICLDMGELAFSFREGTNGCCSHHGKIFPRFSAFEYQVLRRHSGKLARYLSFIME